MALAKPLDELTFDDIKRLKENRIEESVILDYKQALIDDDSFIKSVSSFANTQGGVIVFGVEESGKGGYPTAIPGLDLTDVNKERLEQLILSNIHPRLFVRVAAVPHEHKTKCVLIVRIPDSYIKPHMNNRDSRYYRRYNFEAQPMTETEVADAYRRRMSSSREVDEYVRELHSTHRLPHFLHGQIAVIPQILDKRIIDSYDPSSVSWIDPNTIDFKPSGFIWAPKHGYLPGPPRPFARGIVCARKDDADRLSEYLEIHRNGCVAYGDDFAAPEETSGNTTRIFQGAIFCVRLLHTLQFANSLYSRYNYFGDVRIVVRLEETSGLYLQIGRFASSRAECASVMIAVEREFPSSMLGTHFSWIASGIMHEIFNHFEVWRCHYFDDEGNYLVDKLNA
jgi:hypothetical protein